MKKHVQLNEIGSGKISSLEWATTRIQETRVFEENKKNWKAFYTKMMCDRKIFVT